MIYKDFIKELVCIFIFFFLFFWWWWGGGGVSNSFTLSHLAGVIQLVWFGLHVLVRLLVSRTIRSYLHLSIYIIYMYILKDRFLADGNSKHMKNCRNTVIDDDILRPTIFRLYIYMLPIIHLCCCSILHWSLRLWQSKIS